ncbi:AAA family ATPase [Rathayibacter rathayi]|uniref:AAA family ATPase n=1 Tax=Rathayibacter rathayi TaxID=33887 RepID=UPI0021583F80|nr:ATP-binding protein [Rathayibacter rathayi]
MPPEGVAEPLPSPRLARADGFTSGRLYIVIGPAGSGKSTVSTRLARRLRAAYVDKDSVATLFTESLLRLAGTDPQTRDDNVYYQDHVLEVEYRTLLRLAGDNLRLGTPIVLDAPFVRFFPQEDFLEKAAREFDWPPSTEIVVVHVTADRARMRERVIGRGYDRDAWKITHWDEFWRAARAADCRWLGAKHVTIDNSSADPGALEEALTVLVSIE